MSYPLPPHNVEPMYTEYFLLVFVSITRELNLSIMDKYVKHLQQEQLEGIYGESMDNIKPATGDVIPDISCMVLFFG